MTIQMGPNTFTLQRVRTVVHSAICHQRSSGPRFNPRIADFRQDGLQVPQSHGVLGSLATPQEKYHLTSVCLLFLQHIRRAQDHVTRVDEVFSQLLEFNIVGAEETADKMIDRTYRLLGRCPLKTSPYEEHDAVGLCSALPSEYFMEGAVSREPSNLKLACFIPTNVIRFATQTVAKYAGGSWYGPATKPFIGFIGDIYDAAIEIEPSKTILGAHLLILRTFLWTAWHRCVTLHRRYSLRTFRGSHGRSILNQYQIFRTLTSKSTSHQHKLTTTSLPPNLPDYMCPWALRLVASDRMSIAADLQGLISRFQDAFPQRAPRCIRLTKETFEQCDGTSPEACGRFAGADIEDQSAHAVDCSGKCPRVYWDEASYCASFGARAVEFNLTQANQISYCTASKRTMAISHVWSHGQGGRPEDQAKGGTGFNLCLHKRFSHIAQKNGCDSYWMDTPCIPQEHHLRAKAIQEINGIFWNSKLTLVCDKDIMKLDGDISCVEGDISLGEGDISCVEAAERLLATLLVCDWNVRAWTLLEGVRGSTDLHLLCKDDKVVRVSEVLSAVYKYGDVELANLFLSMTHLLPVAKLSQKEIDHTKSISKDPTPEVPKFSIVESSGLLSGRHASRSEDEILIWSLFSGIPVCDKPVDFWGHVEQVIDTEYLLSDIPRVTSAKGLSWAPKSPNSRNGSLTGLPKPTFSESTENIAILDRTRGSITATWQACDINDAMDWWKSYCTFLSWLFSARRGIWRFWEWPPMSKSLGIRERAARRIGAYYWDMAWLSNSTRTKLISFKAEAGVKESVLLLRPRYHSDSSLMVLVASTDSKVYKWVRIVRWDTKDGLLPPFLPEKEILLE